MFSEIRLEAVEHSVSVAQFGPLSLRIAVDESLVIEIFIEVFDNSLGIVGHAHAAKIEVNEEHKAWHYSYDFNLRSHLNGWSDASLVALIALLKAQS
jgi:hypothetical protein